MNKFYLIIITVIILQQGIIAQQGWYGQSPKPTGSDLSSVFYADNNTIWTVGGSGYALKSTDGGISWESNLVGANYVLSGIQFIDQLSGIVYGLEIEYEPGSQVNQYGIILATSDGGNNWTLKYRDHIKPNYVFFLNQINGWAVADSGKVFKTTDGGNNWTEYYCGYNTSLKEVSFLDSLNGWTIGAGIFKTSDGGINWEDVSPIGDSFNSMHFLNNDMGWVCGSEIYKTTDGGGSWIQLTSLGFGIWNDIQFIDPDNGWCLNYDFPSETMEIIKTNDGGETWSTQYSNPEILPNALHFINMNIGGSVGSYGSILTTSNGGSNWELRTEWLPMSLHKVDFPSLEKGFAIGHKGSGFTATSFIVKSADGGINWEVSDSLTNAWYMDLFFIDDSKGWVVGVNFADAIGFIHYTDNGGSSWSTQYVYPDYAFSSIYFTDVLNGWAGIAGSAGNLLYTTNGGTSWVQKSTGYSINPREIFFVNNNNGWVIGSGTNKIIKTSDGGFTWLDMTPPDLIDILYDIDFVNEQIGWVVGKHGIALKTTDGGLSWDQSWPEPWPQGPSFSSVDFIDENVGWIVTNDEIAYPNIGDFTYIFYTSDGGDNWNLQAFLNGHDGSIFFLDQHTGWFVGGNNVFGEPKIGYVYKTTTGGVVSVNEEEKHISSLTNPTLFLLHQNYPNPFNPSTIIKFSLPITLSGAEGSFVTLKIYNALGEEVAVLLDKELTASTYEVKWNAAGLPSGVYFYKLQINGFVETKKMLLLK